MSRSYLSALWQAVSVDGTEQWESRLLDLWATIDDRDEKTFLAMMDGMVSELPPGDAVGLFERASAWDSLGHSDRAVPLYQAALEQGLSVDRRRRAVIQMASSMRNLGKARDAVALLTAELELHQDDLDGAVRAFLALALVDVGREREAVATALAALSNYLPCYNKSVARYARELADHGH